MTYAEHRRANPAMKIPAVWNRLLLIVAIGKGAVVGTGVMLAALGALDIAFAITAQQFLTELKPHFFDYAALGGGVIGAIAGAILRV